MSSTTDTITREQFDEYLKENKLIALLWGTDDVQTVRPDLTDEQAWEVLKVVDKNHDATRGVTWDTLESEAYELFGSMPEKISATYVSVWDGGVEIRTPCQYDGREKVVSDIETTDPGNVETLEQEYIELPNGITIDRDEFDIEGEDN